MSWWDEQDQQRQAAIATLLDSPRGQDHLRHANDDRDDGYWLQVEPVDLLCPAGHRGSWLDHTSLLDEAGTYIAFTDLFGRAPGAPYAECRDCLAYDDGQREQLCLCDDRHIIYCPTCDQRCRLERTAVPTFPGQAQP